MVRSPPHDEIASITAPYNAAIVDKVVQYRHHLCRTGRGSSYEQAPPEERLCGNIVIPSTVIKNVVLLGITYAEQPDIWTGVECKVKVPETYLIRIGDKEFTIAHSDWMDWEPDPYPGEPEIGATIDLFVRKTWARVNGFAK